MTDVPVKKIKQGYERSSNHIASLLKSSQILYDATQYSHSLALSILAREELAKLLIIQNHLKDKTPIQYNEWKNLTKGTSGATAHKIRLTLPHKFIREHMQNLSLDKYYSLKHQSQRLGIPRGRSLTFGEVTSLNEEYEKAFEKFDQIKQECFYLGWNGNFFNLSTKLSPNEMRGLAYTHLMDIKMSYYSALSIRVHEWITPEIESTMKNDPNFKESLRLRREMETTRATKLARLALQALDKISNS